MTIRNKTLVAIIITFIMLIVILYIVLGSVFQQGFIRLEEKDTHNNVKRVINILSREINTLNTFNWDWSSWDDTYTFIEDSNEEYIKSNLMDQTFIGARLNLILFINSSNQVVFGKAFDLEEEEEIPIPEDLLKHLLPDSLLTTHSNTDSSVKGIILLSKHPIFITSRSILTSDNEGPIRGALIMGRYLESTEIEHLAQISNLSVNVQKFNDSQSPLDFQKAFSILSEEEPIFIQPLNNELIAGYILIKDIYGEPILVLRANMPRDIYRQSQITRRYFIFSILAIGMIFSLLVLLFLERLVLFPINRVNKYLDIVTSTKDLSFRIPLKRKDEISKLSNTINFMLEKLEESRKELWNSRELYKNLFENIPGVFYRADREGNILMINPEGAKSFGYNSSEDILGKEISQHLYFAPEERKKYLKELENNKGNLKDFEITLKKKDGSPLVISDTSHYYYDKEGNIAGVEGVFVDITERKQMEEKLRRFSEELELKVEERTKELKEAQDQLIQSEKLSIIGELAMGVAHEVRNPLAIISLITQHLEGKCADDYQIKKLQTIQKNINRIDKIVHGLLDFSHPPRSNFAYHNVNEILDRLSILENLPSENIKIIKKYETKLPRAWFNPDRLEQVFLNLMSNAMRAMKNGGELYITTSFDSTRKGIIIKFEDTGAGISEGNLKKIFNPFFTTYQEGTGLGLSICQNIINEHKGNISVESKLGKGTAFTIFLPLEKRKEKKQA